MTKTITKIIAGLGIVAGLGVAALPLSSFAAEIPVSVVIGQTIGSVAPDCVDVDMNNVNYTATGSCAIGGASNAPIQMSLRISQEASNLNSTTTNLVSGSNNIPALSGTANLADTGGTGFTLANLENLNAGAGGWGFRVTTSTAGLTVVDNSSTSGANYGLWNGMTLTNEIVARSAGAIEFESEDTVIHFRAITPVTQAPGTYTNTVTLTVANYTP